MPAVRISLSNPFTGKRISITRPTRKQAEEVRAKVWRAISDMRDGHLTIPAGLDRIEQLQYGRVRPLIVDTVYADWVATKSGRTAASLAAHWTRHFAPAFQGKHPAALTEDLLRYWWETVGGAESTRLTLFAYLKAAIHLAVRSEKLASVPWKGWRPPKVQARERPAARNDTEIEAIIAAAFVEDRGVWPAFSDLSYRVAFLLMTGLRQGEAAALGWDAIDWGTPGPTRAGEARVVWQATEGWTTEHPDWKRPMAPLKGRRARRAPLSDTCLALLERQRAQLLRHGFYRLDGPVFPGVGGTWRRLPIVLTPERMRTLARNAGIAQWERWTTHCARHTFVSTTARGATSGNLRDLMDRTGHADFRMLLRYMHETDAGPAPAAHGRQLFLPALDSSDPLQTKPPGG